MIKNVDNFGYILEVDLKDPDKLHVLHNDYPLAPEKQFLMTCCQFIIKKLRTNTE